MKKLLLTIAGLFFFVGLFAQLGNDNCSTYQTYQDKVKKENYKSRTLPTDIFAYGEDDLEAIYNLKIKLLHRLMFNDQQLQNPILDSILGQFAGDIIKLQQSKYDVFPSKKRDRSRGAYTAITGEYLYNTDVFEYVKQFVNEFINYTSVFIINPNIQKNADKPTKELYADAKSQFETAFMKSDMKFGNILEARMLQIAKLQPAPTDYSPCKNGFIVHQTNQGYLDIIEGLRQNENFSYDLDIIFSIDTITYDETSISGKTIVMFKVLAYNVNNAVKIMQMEIRDTVEHNTPYNCVKNAISDQVIAKALPDMMYEVVKRYAVYVKEGFKFSIKLCGDLIPSNKERLNLKRNLIACKILYRMHPASWTMKGKQIGKIYTGYSHLLDRMELSYTIEMILLDSGIENYEIHPYGADFIITPEINK